MRQNFAAAAASYDSAAVLAREVGERLAARLQWVRLAPQRMADIGCATGDGIRLLQARFPAAWPLAVDYVRPMLQAVDARSGWWSRTRGRAPRLLNADVRQLPLAAHSLDLVWSNLMLHWLADDDLARAFGELQRVLAVGGLLHFALLGPDTLKALRDAARDCAAVLPAPTFLDMHDIGDMLLTAGFADPVMEMEMLTLTYRTPQAFLADLRRLGVRDALLGADHPGAPDFRAWRRIFAAWPREAGCLPARFEILYGHAWKAALMPPAGRLPDGRALMRFQPMGG